VAGSALLTCGLKTLAKYLTVCAVLAGLTYGGFVLQVNLLIISFIYLLVVVAVASLFGFWQATLISLLAVACLDYFFTQPILHFYMTDPREVVALGAFEITTIVISRLSAKELRSSRKAAAHRVEMEQLYELSRSSLLLDLRQPQGPQLVILIHRIFGARAVALFDMSLSRQDRMGNWDAGEEDVAKECYLRGARQDAVSTQTWRRVLRAGPSQVGALVVRGDLSSLVVDALASLAAIAIDRHQWFEKEERSETAQKGEQLRAAVLDALAHELKTPLTAVQTASSGLLEMGALNDRQCGLVTLINDEAIRLNDLCTRLLQTARLDTEHIGLEMNDVNILELISQVLLSQTGGWGRDRSRVTVDDPALTVRVDRGLLEMILAQYIDNARKYSAPGTPIEIAARKSHSEVHISVHNIGSTIRIEDRDRIFERFYRSPDTKDDVPGTGIGLSIVKKAAEAHHGHAWVISDDTEGTTFFLSLPDESRRTR
jgi:two-component system sensor histidine kinase KdpD